MTKRQRWLAIGAAALVAVALAIALPLALTGGGGPPKNPTHADYEVLWDGTHLGDPMKEVLSRWPAPYQHYKDNLKDDCYEWSDKPNYLYNLCFKDGVLRLKTLF
jgi:hypothetical protein